MTIRIAGAALAACVSACALMGGAAVQRAEAGFIQTQTVDFDALSEDGNPIDGQITYVKNHPSLGSGYISQACFVKDPYCEANPYTVITSVSGLSYTSYTDSFGNLYQFFDASTSAGDVSGSADFLGEGYFSSDVTGPGYDAGFAYSQGEEFFPIPIPSTLPMLASALIIVALTHRFMQASRQP